MPSCWKLAWCFCSDPGRRPKISSPVHLLLKPPDAELLGHAFKQKQFRKSRPCNLCHQPVKNIGSSCRVCKYTCHRTCEPKVWRACRHSNPSSFKNLSQSCKRSFQDPARLIFQHDRSVQKQCQHHGGLPTTVSLKSLNGTEPLMSRPSSGGRQATISPSRRMDSLSGCAERGGGPSSSSAMDLSFVTERILALSFPPEMDTTTYREALHQAASMLQTKHGDNYMVFNLSLPRKEIGLWNPRVLDVGWPDQLAPPLERLCSVCRALDSWLQADPQHVAVLHSKCGLQRVGVVVAAYCEYTGLCPPNQQDQQSLDRFSMKRFLNERVGGLRTPSDKRYVEYFAGLLSGAIQVNSSPLFLDHVTVVGIPAFQSNGGCRAFFKVYQGSVPVHTSSIYNLHDSARHFTMSLGDRGLALRGDILVKCYHRHRLPVDGRETIFSLQFHTCAVTQHTLVFQRQDLDDAYQDLRFPLDGSVRLHFSTSPESRLMGVNETHTRYTVESSTGDPVVRWDSYDTVTDSASCTNDHHRDASSSAGLKQNHRLAHTYGPLDGSLYAKVLKQNNSPKATASSAPPLIVTATSSGGSDHRSASRFSDPSSSSLTSGGTTADYHHLHHHLNHLNHPVQFLNSPHVASTDSGISSAGVVRSGGGSSTHNRDLGGSGSTSASPPHSGRSAESSGAGGVFLDPPPQTPSPVQQQQQQLSPLPQALQRMPSIVETRAEIHRDDRDVMMTGSSSSSAPPSSLTATDELDQLLSGMLMNVQNIPDIRPEHRHHYHHRDDIDVDSIQVKFDLTPSRDTTDRSVSSPSHPAARKSNSGYVYESDTVRRAYPAAPTPQANVSSLPSLKMPSGPVPQHPTPSLQQQPSVRPKDIPYHAREDSKPFTYGMVGMANGHHHQENGGAGSVGNGMESTLVTSTPVASASMNGRNWKESSSNTMNGQHSSKRLESPSLVRKFSNGSEPVNISPVRSSPRIPVPSIADPVSPRPIRKLSESLLLSNGGGAGTSSPTSSEINATSTSNSTIQPVATSSPRLDTSRNRSALTSETMKTMPMPSSQMQHQISLEETIQDISTSPDSSRMSTSNDMAGLSWLQRQQQKLRERKDSVRKSERNPQEVRLMSELQSSRQFRGQLLQHQQSTTSTIGGHRPVDDAGYLSDVTLFSELDMVNTSREGSPDIRSLYATPLHINTAGTYGQYQQQPKTGQAGNGVNKTLSSSNPASPLLTHRSASLERSGRYVIGGGDNMQQQQQQQQQEQQQQRLTLTRQKSDMSHDRERPFVAVKRAHEQHMKTLNSSNGGQLNPNDLLVTAASPYGLIGYHHHGSTSPANVTSVTGTSSELISSSRTGLLSTVTDHATTSPSPSSAQAVHQSINRLGNLDWLIHSLNTNLPDPAALIREPNLNPNLKHLIHGGNCNNSNNAQQRSPAQHVADHGKSPFYNRHHSFSSSLPARANFAPVTGMANTSTNTNNKFPKSSDSVMSWNSSLSGDLDMSGNRPTTPAFPVVPRTPYLNVHHQGYGGRQSIDSPVTPTSCHSGAGLPPKSPTTQRRYAAGYQQVNIQPYSPTPPSTAKILRKWPSNSSVSSKERSISPSPSSAYLGQSQSRRSSVQSVSGLSEPQEVSSVHVNFVKDNSRYWYKPNIAREDAITMLKDQSPGTFIVRDSNSFPGAFGLALKVATPPPHVASKNIADPSSELVRHFLIEPTSKGVRIKGCSNEPVFGSLSALIYQHSVTPLALPIKLVLPENDLIFTDGSSMTVQSLSSPTTQLLTQGAACSLLYLFTMDTESLTGPQAIQRTMTHLLEAKPLPMPTIVHFKVSSQGITLTDNERKLFFRRHYPVLTVSYCGLDPEDRRWNQRNEETGLPISSNRCFGFIARKQASKTDNQCHIFAELEAEQPATAIVNFVTKVMMTSSSPSPSKNNV